MANAVMKIQMVNATNLCIEDGKCSYEDIDGQCDKSMY